MTISLARFSSARQAFTLIEMLIVIAIIGILAAISIPVVEQVRLNARSATISSNLQQIYTGVMLWAGDNGNCYLPARGAAIGPAYDWYWYGRKYTSDDARFMTPLAKYLNTPVKDWRALNQTTVSPLNRSDSSLPSTSAYGYPYMVNYQVMIHGDGSGGASKTPVPVSRLNAPSRIVLMAHSIASDSEWSMGRALFDSFAAHMATPFNGRGHVLWADGHVTLERPKNLTDEMIRF